MSKILVFGGTRFFGKELIKELIINGHDITILTRGNAKDNFGDDIKRIQANKRNEKALIKALEGKEYDVVYDTICYSSKDADRMCRVLNGKTKKYIVVSSVSVYDKGYNLKETDFNPNKYNIIMGEKEEFSYGEGKRLMEATLYKNAKFKVIAVRFPVVIGKDDYTKRLFFYVEHTMKSIPMNIDNLNYQMGFIRSDEAGKFMAFLVYKDIRGAINGSSKGTISIREIIEYVEKKTRTKAIINKTGENAPYNGVPEYSINTKKAELLGFRFSILQDWIYELLDYYIELVN